MIDILFFDLDDTLLDFSAGEARAVSQTLREFGADPTPETVRRYHEINKHQWELLEDGVFTREEILVRRFRLLFEELGTDFPGEPLCRRYEDLLAWQHDLLPGAAELLDTLAGKYRLYVASNGSAEVQHRRLAESGLEKWFDGVFISQEVGADKPDPAFFDACFRAIPGFSRERALMVGDSLTSDIRGGIRAGLRTCWLDRFAQEQSRRTDIVPDHRITDLSQLPALLERLNALT